MPDNHYQNSNLPIFLYIGCNGFKCGRKLDLFLVKEVETLLKEAYSQISRCSIYLIRGI